MCSEKLIGAWEIIVLLLIHFLSQDNVLGNLEALARAFLVYFTRLAG
jgi:hypothetical protein